MKCYVDAKVGVEKGAYAVCAICGRGLCLEHAHEITKQIPQKPGWVLHEASYILCGACVEAVS